MIGLGLVNGLDGSNARVRSSVENLSATVKSVPFGAGSGTRGPGVTGGVVVNSSPQITIHAPSGDATAIGDAVQKAIGKNNDDLIRRLSAGSISSAAG